MERQDLQVFQGEALSRKPLKKKSFKPKSIWNRVPWPLPWFILDIHDNLIGDRPGALLITRWITLNELTERYGFTAEWILNRGLGEIMSVPYSTGQVWIKIKAYPGYLNPIRQTA